MTEKNGTKVSLRTYIEMKISDLEKASDLAAENLKIRLDSLNEWRAQNKDEREKYLPREEYELQHSYLSEKIDSLSKLVYIGIGVCLAIEALLKIL
jgi:hypothetical protein